MELEKKEVTLSKIISKILRHKPEMIGILLDENGWADVKELLNGINRLGNEIDKKLLDKIVEGNNKKRFGYNEDESKIRARQGHSINVDVQLKVQVPPKHLYHGTAQSFMESIENMGILKQRRQHVHLSKDMETAFQVGKRHGKPVVFVICAKKMHEDGHVFYLSENGVWLTDRVPTKYMERKVYENE